MKKKLGKIIAATALALMMTATSVFAAASGDANLDNKTDLNDAKIILKAALGISRISDAQANANADINQDGKVDLNDAKYALKKALGIKDYSLDYKYGDSKVNIYYNVYENEKGVTLIVRNGRSGISSVMVTITYYNGDSIVGTKNIHSNYAFESNKENVFFFNRPYDAESDTYPAYDRFRIEISASEALKSIYADVDSIKYTMTPDKDGLGLVGIFTNNYGKAFAFINATVIYYDENGNVIGTSEQYLDCKEAGSTDDTIFYYPTDSSLNRIIPASYEVFVNYAYGYN